MEPTVPRHGRALPIVVPGYTVHEKVGEGSVAAVYAATRVRDGANVAIKILRIGPGDEDEVARSINIAAGVRGEHLVRVHEVLALGTGAVAVVMDLVRAGTLDALVQARGYLTPGEAVTVLVPIAAAVASLHRAGVVHGDVSARNILLHPHGEPVLTDLGLAGITGDPSRYVWGTPGFVAPEVAGGCDHAPAGDVFSLGAVGWFALSGDVPQFGGPRGPLADSTRLTNVPDQLRRTIESALEADPDRRCTADEFAHEVFSAVPASPLGLATGVEGTDVTRRLRELAARPASGGPERAAGAHREAARASAGRWWVRRARLLTAAVATVALAVTAVLVVATARRPDAVSAAQPAIARPTLAPSAAQRPVARPTLAPSAAQRPVARPTVQVSPATPATSATPASLPSTAGVTTILSRFAQVRTAAWRSGDPDTLDRVYVDGSAALERDAAALAQARASAAHYEGLAFSVERVTGAEAVAGRPDQVQVVATLATSAHAVEWGAGQAREVPARSERVSLTLQRDEDGWRIASIRPRA